MRHILEWKLCLSALLTIWCSFAPPAAAHNVITGAGVITDLPAGAVLNQSGINDGIDFSLIERVSADAAFLRVCAAVSATCTVSRDVNQVVPDIGFVCHGFIRDCWTSFLESLRHGGARVLVSPGRGGASFHASWSPPPAPDEDNDRQTPPSLIP